MDLYDEIREKLNARKGTVRDQIAELEKELSKIEDLIDASGSAPKTTKPSVKRSKPKPKARRKPVKRTRTSDETLNRVLAFVNENPFGVTAWQVRERVGVGDSAAYAALNMLRERGQIRMAGSGPRERGMGRHPSLYKAVTNGVE